MPSPVEVNQTLSALTLMVAIAGFLILLVTPNTERFHQLRVLGIAFFCAGLGATAAFFLLRRPDVLEGLQENLALVLVGMVIATLSAIRLFKR